MLTIDKSETKGNKVCGMRLIIPGNDLMADAQCKTFEEAAMLVTNVLKRQIEKRKKHYSSIKTAGSSIE